MYKNNKKFNKIHRKISILIVLIFLSLFFISNSINVNANANTSEVVKQICNATIDDNFADDTILVTLTQSESLKFLDYTKDNFNNLELASVSELTEEISTKLDEQINSSINSESNLDTIYIQQFKRTLILKLLNPSKATVLDYIKLLEKREDIYCAEPSYIGEFISTSSNDPFRNNQWALNTIQIYNAWDITTGVSSVKVGVVDSGIDISHPDLTNRVNRALSKDCTGNNNPWADGNYHGTHVAGIIGAEGNNSLGVSGVNWSVELISLKVGNESPSSEAVAEAITHAYNNDINILNLSLSVRETTAINNAINLYNGIIVCAAGNSYNSSVGYPACLDNPKIISVGSIERNNSKSDFSSWGKVDIWAPGRDILSTIPRAYCLEHNIVFNDGTRLCEFHPNDIEFLNYRVNNGVWTWEEIVEEFETLFGCEPNEAIVFPHEDIGYHYESGTSMAAPYVTGVAALILSKFPHLSGPAMKEILLNGVEMIYDENGNSVYEEFSINPTGVLNAYQAINSYKTLTKNVETEVINNLNHGKGLFGFSYYGSGFVDITMNAVIQNATPSYPNGSFRLLNSKGEVVKKYEMTNYSDEAINKNGYNTLSVFLPESGYYYIDVDYDVENLSSLKLLVENNDVYSPSVNLFNFNDYQEFSIGFIDNVSSVDYFKQITLKQAASFEFDITLNGSARFVVLKRTSSSASSELTVIENEVIIGNNTIEVDLSHGTYYIGYFDLSQGSIFGLTMNRFVTESGSSLLITDPDQYTNCGSQITVAEMNTNASNRSYRQNTIIEGFTRIIYLGNGNSRQAYYWYSSNEDVATVSEFGTVFAQNVTQDTTVKIMAVYKTDPSIVYIKEFRILNDTESYASSPLNVDGIALNVHAGQFTYITFGDKDVPINWLQYYSWESSDTDYVTVDGFGRIYAYSSAIGETFTITGIYNYNTRVKITITVNIIQ